MKTKIYLLLGFTLAFSALLLGRTDWDVFGSGTKTIRDFTSNQQQLRINQLEEELRAMSLKIEAMEKKQKKLVTHTQQEINTAMRNLQEHLAIQLAEMESEDLLAMNNQAAGLDTSEEELEKNVLSDLEKQLYAGTKDDEWEKTLEQQINHTLEKNLDNNTALLDIHCETSLCKIEVEHEEADTKMLFMTYLTQLEAFNDKETFYKTDFDENGNETTLLYVAREGYRLPEIPGL